jgi:predicted transcriptional regulator
MHNTKLIENENFIFMPRKLVKEFGHTAAYFLSFVQKLMTSNDVGIIHENQKWIGYSTEQWAEKMAMSSSTYTRILKKLCEAGVISVKKLHPCKQVRTNYITINMGKLNNAF